MSGLQHFDYKAGRIEQLRRQAVPLVALSWVVLFAAGFIFGYVAGGMRMMGG